MIFLERNVESSRFLEWISPSKENVELLATLWKKEICRAKFLIRFTHVWRYRLDRINAKVQFVRRKRPVIREEAEPNSEKQKKSCSHSRKIFTRQKWYDSKCASSIEFELDKKRKNETILKFSQCVDRIRNTSESFQLRSLSVVLWAGSAQGGPSLNFETNG